MPEYIVKYKLVNNDNGYITPEIILGGGYVWDNNGKIEDMILVGKANYKVTEGTPEGIIERISQDDWDNHKQGQSDGSLKDYKAKKYAETADKLFQEAYREKELGRTDKWEAYLKVCDDIYKLTTIPKDIIHV